MRILIVEDDKFTQAALLHALRSLGYGEAESVASGEEAIARVTSAEPDIILMDIRLGAALDGVETVEQIRKDHDVPVVFLTMDADEETMRRAVATEPFAFLIKPVRSADLKAAIEVACFKHTMEKERRRLTEELQRALQQVKLLSGLLPICANCKKIRDDHGYWTEVECYIRDHSAAQFTHGICPGCAQQMYAQVARWDEF